MKESHKMNEDGKEKDIFNKYLKKGYSLLGRIKYKLFKTRKRVKTIKDLQALDNDMMIKLLCLILIVLLINYVGTMIWKLWLWLFPSKIGLVGPYF